MEPVTVIALAKTLISATGLDDWVSEKIGDTFGEKTAEKIVDIAGTVTGFVDPKEALKSIRKSERVAREFSIQLAQQENKLRSLCLDDIADAREMYESKSEMGDKIATNIMRWNLLSILLLIIGNGLIIQFVDNPTIAVAVGNVIGASISYLWQERQQVIVFFFGPSLGNKVKSDLKLKKTKV